MTALAPTLQAFFTDRLISQRGASPHTIAAYRDTFRLLPGFAVGCLLRWYREGADVQSRLPWLSAYLGHKDPRSTYWYYSDSRVIPMSAPSRA